MVNTPKTGQACVSTLWKRVFQPTNLCTVKAIADPALDKVKEKWGELLPDCTWYTDAEEMHDTDSAIRCAIGALRILIAKDQKKD